MERTPVNPWGLMMTDVGDWVIRVKPFGIPENASERPSRCNGFILERDMYNKLREEPMEEVEVTN